MLANPAIDNTTVVCNTDPYVYTQGFLNCAVENDLLSGLFPGSTTLAVQKTVQPNISLSYPFGSPDTLLAQLFYAPNTSTAPAEQFYCQASSCTQEYLSDKSGVDYNCAVLACTCIPGQAFCGGRAIDLSSTINALQGPVDVTCSTNSTTCNFKQDVLNGIVGSAGLGLTGCQSGECVRQGVIDRLDPNYKKAESALSGGVIAGLVIVGVIVIAVLVLFILGKIRQRKARAVKVLGSPRQVALSYSNISYALPSSSSSISTLRRRVGSASANQSLLEKQGLPNSTGTQILHSISGSVPCGSMLAIIGASGAGKRYVAIDVSPALN